MYRLKNDAYHEYTHGDKTYRIYSYARGPGNYGLNIDEKVGDRWQRRLNTTATRTMVDLDQLTESLPPLTVPKPISKTTLRNVERATRHGWFRS